MRRGESASGIDATNGLVGMRRTDPKRANAFPVKQKARTRCRSIAAGAFLRHFGIRVDQTLSLGPLGFETSGLASCGMSHAVIVGHGRDDES